MGEIVELPGNATTRGGYLAAASEGAGLGVVVVKDGPLVDHVGGVCDRFSAEGFTALAPDLRPGDWPESGTLDLEGTAHDLSAAVDFLQAHPAVRGQGVGVVGFATGGALALWLATLRPDSIRAVVPFCGLPPAGAEPDWSALAAPVEGHYAEHDEGAAPEAVARFEERLRALGKEVQVFTYRGTGHSFFDDTRPEGYDEDSARQAWVRTLEFLRAKMG